MEDWFNSLHVPNGIEMSLSIEEERLNKWYRNQ